MYLGEVMAETLDKNFRVIQDPVATAYLQEIGDRLVKHLPPSNIKFTFFIVDSPELNAFNVAGGRIYVTRKLLSFVKSEDELAGVLGHELGHGIVRHNAIDMSRVFKEILKVDRLGDRQDVFDKFNEMIDKRRTRRVRRSSGHVGDQQLEADRLGLFAMIAAGYDPDAYVNAWDRLTETNGDTGSAFSDFFGVTRPAEKRLREMLKALGTVPTGCRERRQTASDATRFETWKSTVLSISRVERAEKLPGLIRQGELKPGLKGTIERFRFSPDGKYLLAQDSSGVNVMQRQPFTFLFRLDVTDAKGVQFSPDSKNLVIQTYGLRVEIWSVETRKPVMIREVYSRESCLQTLLSPDGKTLACYNTASDLNLIDVDSNEKIVSVKDFYKPSLFIDGIPIYASTLDKARELSILKMAFSPDGRYFVGGRTFGFGMPGVYRVKEAVLAYDFRDGQSFKLTSSLKNLISQPFTFYSNDQLVGQNPTDPKKSGIYSFPTGQHVEQFHVKARYYGRPFGGDYILVSPTENAAIGVYSVSLKKIVLGSKSRAMDGHGDFFVTESADGVIDLVRLYGETIASQGTVRLPRTDIGDIRTVTVSDDLGELVLSESDRGGVWDLGTGDLKIRARGFRGSYVDEKGDVFVDLLLSDEPKRMVAKIDLVNGSISEQDLITTSSTRQHGKLLVRRKTKRDEEREKRAKPGENSVGRFEDVESKAFPGSNPSFSFEILGTLRTVSFPFVALEVSDVVDRQIIWSMRFDDESPSYDINWEANTATLYWSLTTKAASAIIKDNPALAARAKNMGKKEGDYLIQVLNASTGKQIGVALIETGEGSFRIKRATTFGNWLSIADSENRIQFYDLSTGELKGRVFGEDVTVSPAKSLAVVENILGILSVVDLNTGQRVDDLHFPSAVAYSTFNRAGDKLFVLTVEQKYYIFDANKFRRNSAQGTSN